MYCKICGKKLDNNIDYCQECEEKQKHYKSSVDDKIIDDYNKEVQQKSINLSSQEKSTMQQNNNINIMNTNNDNNGKSFATLLKRTWIISIIISVIINGLGYLWIINADLGLDWTGFGNAVGATFLIVILNFITVLIYAIVNIKKIIKNCFKDYKKSSIYFHIIILFIILMLITANPIVIPYVFLLSSTVTLIINDKTGTDKFIKENNGKNPFMTLSIVLLVILIVSKAYPLLYYNTPLSNSCKEYIASTDNYVYCKTYNKIKQINLNDKSVKYYGKDISYHRDLVYEDYIFYTNITNNYKSMDLYILNIKNGKSKRIKRFSGMSSITFNIQDNNAYFNVFTGTNNDPNETNYIYNIKNNKLETLSNDIDNILYATGNKIYYCKSNVISIYDIKIKKDSITSNKCENDIFTDMVDDDNVYYNQYRFLTRGGKLYIYDALNSNNDVIIDDEIMYYFMYYYHNNIYVFSTPDSYKTTDVSYYDFTTKSLIKTGLSLDGSIGNSVDEVGRYYSIIIKDEVVYYYSKKHLYTYNLKTKVNSELINDISSFGGVNDDYVYYFDSSENFVRYNMNSNSIDIIETKNNN